MRFGIMDAEMIKERARHAPGLLCPFKVFQVSLFSHPGLLTTVPFFFSRSAPRVCPPSFEHMAFTKLPELQYPWYLNNPEVSYYK